jgi:hypothetical protein
MICKHAMQHIAIEDRRHQHLAGAVAGALVDLLEEGQRRMDLLERLIVVDIGQVELLRLKAA